METCGNVTKRIAVRYNYSVPRGMERYSKQGSRYSHG